MLIDLLGWAPCRVVDGNRGDGDLGDRWRTTPRTSKDQPPISTGSPGAGDPAEPVEDEPGHGRVGTLGRRQPMSGEVVEGELARQQHRPVVLAANGETSRSVSS